MMRKTLAIGSAFAVGIIFGHLAIPKVANPFRSPNVVMAQTRKPAVMTHLYSGPDNQTHAEDLDLKFAPGGPGEIAPMMQITGSELHRTASGSFEDWHRTSRRQYVITLSGRAEMEIGGGQKVLVAPGTINLIEDSVGKGHTTRVTSTEDRIALHIFVADGAGR